MSRAPPDWLKKRTPCPFYPTGRCVFADKCNFIHDGEVSRKQHRMRGQVPAYRRTPENSVDSFSSSEEDQVVQEPHIDEHSAAAPSLVFSSIYGGRPNSINRLGLDVDLPVSPESLPNSPPRRPTSHHSSHGHINITSPTPSRPLSAALGIGIGGRAQGLAEVFTAVATAQAQATALPPSTAGSLPSPLSLSPKSPPPDAQELVIKDDNFTLEQFPFKLALSNQSSLLLNRTTRAAARRGSSLPQRSGSSSSSTPDKTKKPTNLSAPERFSVSSVPRRVGDDEESLDRPGSHSRSVSGSSLLEEEEEQADDEDEDEDEPHIIDEPPSLEALQPYPRDVSNEPSPEPTARQFVTPIPPPPPPPAQEERQPMPRRYTVRSNSDRHIGHEALLDELEERLGVEPRRKRARSGGSAQLLEQAQNLPTQPTPSSAPAPKQEPRRSSMGKAVDMDAARNMLTAMFAKRAVQEDVTPSSDEQEVEQDQSFLPADWDVGSLVFGTSEMDESEAGDAPRSVSRGVRDVVPVDVYDTIPTTARNSIHSNTRNTIPTDVHDTIPTNAHETTHEDDTTDTDSYSGDSDDEPTEELADIINEQAVLSTPIVLRREVPRETSLPSRTGSGFGTPRTTTLNTPISGTPRNLTLSGSPGAVQAESMTGENVESVSRRGSERLSSLRRSRSGSVRLDRVSSVSRLVDVSGPSLETISSPRLETISSPKLEAAPSPSLSPRVEAAPIPNLEASLSPRLETSPGPRLEATLSPKLEATLSPQLEATTSRVAASSPERTSSPERVSSSPARVSPSSSHPSSRHSSTLSELRLASGSNSTPPSGSNRSPSGSDRPSRDLSPPRHHSLPRSDRDSSLALDAGGTVNGHSGPSEVGLDQDLPSKLVEEAPQQFRSRDGSASPRSVGLVDGPIVESDDWVPVVEGSDEFVSDGDVLVGSEEADGVLVGSGEVGDREGSVEEIEEVGRVEAITEVEEEGSVRANGDMPEEAWESGPGDQAPRLEGPPVEQALEPLEAPPRDGEISADEPGRDLVGDETEATLPKRRPRAKQDIPLTSPLDITKRVNPASSPNEEQFAPESQCIPSPGDVSEPARSPEPALSPSPVRPLELSPRLDRSPEPGLALESPPELERSPGRQPSPELEPSPVFESVPELERSQEPERPLSPQYSPEPQPSPEPQHSPELRSLDSQDVLEPQYSQEPHPLAEPSPAPVSDSRHSLQLESRNSLQLEEFSFPQRSPSPERSPLPADSPVQQPPVLPGLSFSPLPPLPESRSSFDSLASFDHVVLPVPVEHVALPVPVERPLEPEPAPEPQQAQRFSHPDRAQWSERSSLSEIPSLSELAPYTTSSDIFPQNARTQTMASDPRAASEPASKSRPRSQLKPLRLSRMYGLGAPATPVSANTATPTPTHPYTAVSPTPTATGMYPTPSSAHPMQLPTSLRSVSSRSGAEEDAGAEDEEEPVSGGRAESVSWFGSKKGSKQASLSASMRDSVRRSVHSPAAHTAQTTSVPSPTRQRRIVTPPKFTAPEEDEEDVRPLPMVWDDDEISVRSGSVRQRTQSSRSASLSVPAFEVPAEEPTANASSPPKTPNQLPPQTPNGLPPRTPDRLGSMHRYPAFVHLGAASPRVSEGRRTPLVSPSTRSFVSSAPESKAPSVRTSRAPSVRTSRAPSVQESMAPIEQESKAPSELESKAEPEPRSRKWADTINQDSIGSLPAFDAPAQAQPTEAQPTEAQSTDAQPAEAPRSRRPKQRYMQIPNTAPLSISPRRVSPSLMQQSQDEALESYEEDMYPRDDRVPHTAPLHLRLRMAREEGSPTPWMAEYFTNSPSSLHSSQMGRGSMHSNSSSVSTGVKVVPARRSIVVDKQINAPIDEQPEAFGNPGPGPSTMKTFSERRQSAGTLGSPIVLQSPRQERAPTVQEPVPSEPASRRTSRQPSMDATPRKPEEPRVEISSEEAIAEVNSTPRSAAPSMASQSPLRTRTQLQTSPTVQRHMTMASSPGRQPPTPMTAPSPLQILRRNMMARTSPESPRFLSPQTRLTNLPESRPSRHQHHASLAPTPTMQREELRNMPMSAPGPRDRRSLTPSVRFTPMPSRPGSPTQSVQSTLSQTKPLLFFAIAKNSAQEVERLLQVGEAQPDDKAGPDDLPALAFALANEQLTDKTQIVKSLLSHGADPSSVLHRKTGSGEFDDNDLALTTRIEQGMNPAIRYYLNRKRMTIPAPQAELLEKNKFGGLTRAGYGIIGQDAALDELIRVVAGHCRRQTLNPLVIVFSGGPGCGKSLLASKIGPLLHVPTFTVNMTNLRNEAALFNYISMTTKAGNPQIPLVDFLRHNEGQRCVVVLEEIEKAADKTVWHSLLMPWEWGKATVIAPGTNEQIDIDTSQVIWIATSNSGDDATLKFFAERSRPSGALGYDRGDSALARLAQGPRPNDNFARKDYLQLMQAVRKRLGELLGSSMISRVSSVLPFLPFTEEEVYALASESLSAMRADQKADQSAEDVDWEELLQQAVGEYIPGEGARSVHRAVQRAFDEITEW